MVMGIRERFCITPISTSFIALCIQLKRDSEVVKRCRFFPIAQPKIEKLSVDLRRCVFHFLQMVVSVRRMRRSASGTSITSQPVASARSGPPDDRCAARARFRRAFPWRSRVMLPAGSPPSASQQQVRQVSSSLPGRDAQHRALSRKIANGLENDFSFTPASASPSRP